MDSVSVVIPTKNAGTQFKELLKRIRSQTVSNIEIVVVDSGSTDSTVTIAETLADTVIEIPPEEFHHGRTRNLGANATSGDVIVFTVQDAMPANAEWLSKLINPIENSTADVTYGNQIAYSDAKPPDRFFYEYFYPDKQVILNESDTVDQGEFYLNNIFISDVCSAVSRTVWGDFQFQDSVDMSEDKDFAYRIAKEGHTLQYCPEAKIYHSHNYSLQSLFLRRYKDGMAFKDIATGGSDNFLAEGVRYVLLEYIYLIKIGAIHWAPYALLYDLVYFISFILGKNYEYSPMLLHQRLSN